MEKEQKTLEGFKKFVEAQDPDREIDHGSGYSQCAIGEYLGRDYRKKSGRSCASWAWENVEDPLGIDTGDYPTFGALAEALRNAER